MMALLLVSWQTGDWIYSYYDLVLNRSAPYPGLADAFYTLGYASVLVALPLLAYPPRLAASLRWFLDVLLITVVAVCFEWVLVIEPIVSEGGAGSWDSLVALSYPLWDLALVTIIVGGFFAWHANLSARSAVLLAAVATLAITDTLYSVGVLESIYDNAGNPLELGWIAAYMLIGASAMLKLPSGASRYERRMPFVWLAFPFLLALPLPIVQAVRATAAENIDALSLGAAAVLLVAFASHVHASYLTARALDDERRRARLDSLTGTLNHGGILEEGEALIAANPAHKLCIAMVDVDGLKRVNDEFGHRLGDQALKVIASRLRRSGGIVGRYGGDEFLVLFEPHTSLDGRGPDILLSEALADAFVETGPDSELAISASFGLAVYPGEGSELAGLIERADAAMYAQKRSKHDHAVARLGQAARAVPARLQAS